MKNSAGKIAFFKNQFVPIEEANINIQTHALQYGTGAFGGIRAYWNEKEQQLWVFRLEDHYKRLLQSSRILFMNPGYALEDLKKITVELLAKNNWKQNVYLRPFVYKSALELSPRLYNVDDSFAIYTLALDDYLDINSGLRCCVSSWQRINDNAIPTRSKATGGYINSALAKSEASLNGFDEAIFLDANGMVSEGTAANLFIVRDNVLITAPKTASILEGITRRTLLQIAKEQLNLTIEERDISRTELYIADEVFFSGTGVQLAWIKEIDHRTIGNGGIGPVSTKLRQLFFSIVTGNSELYPQWRTPVYPK